MPGAEAGHWHAGDAGKEKLSMAAAVSRHRMPCFLKASPRATAGV